MQTMSIAVVGGGLAGCECALHLARAGHAVTLFEQKPAYRSAAHISDQLAELDVGIGRLVACGLLEQHPGAAGKAARTDG